MALSGYGILRSVAVSCEGHPMEFQSVISLLHFASVAIAVCAFFVFLRQLGTKTLAANRRAALCFSVKLTSYTVLLGVLLICLSAGALLSYGILTTSELPPMDLLILRAGALSGILVSTAFLHVSAMPMLKRASGGNIVDTASAASVLACWILWVLSGTHADEIHKLDVMAIVPAASALVLVLWIILSLFLLGERGYAELKALYSRVKKRLTPPTQLEIQRAQRARRMHSMHLPMAPRKPRPQGLAASA
jgi:hypothetical protein